MKKLIIPIFSIVLFISCTSKSGENLIKAVKNNDFEKVKRITTQENVSFIDEKGATPMMWAAFNGNVEIIDFLIKNGADARKKGVLSVERKDAYDKDVIISYPSPLNAAAGEGHLEAVKFLIEKAGLSSNQKTIKVRDSIDAKGNHSFFDEAENDKSALIEAVLAHKKEVAEYLLSKGADPDYSEYDPEVTALEVAILTFDYEMAELLLRSGANADIFTKRSDGFRIYPFFSIVPEECIPPKMDKADYDKAVTNIIPYLLHAGATRRNFIFPVSKMCECKNRELVEYMVALGFDPDWQFNDTTIGEYCKSQGVEISEEIIKKSLAVRERRDEEDETQKLMMKIIRQQRSKNGSCTRIHSRTKSFSEEAKKVEGKQTNNSSVGGKRSRFSVTSSIEGTIGSIPEIAKNGGRTAEVTRRFFGESREPMIIRGIEDFSCEKDGLTSDAECWEQVDGQYIKSEDCPKPSLEQPDITFSKPFFDPETNLVFVYEHWYCGFLCARISLLVYELKSNGKLEYKYGRTLLVS